MGNNREFHKAAFNAPRRRIDARLSFREQRDLIARLWEGTLCHRPSVHSTRHARLDEIMTSEEKHLLPHFVSFSLFICNLLPSSFQPQIQIYFLSACRSPPTPFYVPTFMFHKIIPLQRLAKRNEKKTTLFENNFQTSFRIDPQFWFQIYHSNR